jgi:hypothetical protein
VDTLVINGRVVMQGRKLTTIDLGLVYKEVEKIVNRLRN